MKKLIIILSTTGLLLLACGDATNKSESNQDSIEDASIEKSVDNKVKTEQTSFNANLKDILDDKKMQEYQFEDFRRYDLGNYVVETIRSEFGTIRLNAFYDENSKLVSLVSSFDNEQTENKYITEQITSIFETFEKHARIIDIDSIEESIEGLYFTGIKTTNSNTKDFLLTFSDLVTKDFFLNDKLNEEYKELLEVGRFAEIHTLANDYIEKNNPDEFDSAYVISDLTKEVAAIDDKLIYEYDDVEKVFNYKHAHVKDISSQNAVVPRFENEKLYIDFGFYNSGWIFMDEIIISTDEDINRLTFKHYDVDTNILNDASIFEKYTTSDFRYIKEILRSDESTVRFKGDNGEIDHVVTEPEKEALDYLTRFDGLYKELSDLQYRFFKL